MKMRTIFASVVFLLLFAFIYTQKFKLNPSCTPERRRNTEYKPTTFVFMIDRSTYWRYLERYLYILKQLSCMIPDNDDIRIIVLDYSADMQLLSHEHRSSDMGALIYSIGWETDTINYEYCKRFKESAGKVARTLGLNIRRQPFSNVQFVVPIIGDAWDATNCSMFKVYDELYKFSPFRDEFHFNSISIHGTHSVFSAENNVIFDIDKVGRIDPSAESMTNPPDSQYASDMKPIVKKLENFVHDKINFPVTVVTSTITSTNETGEAEDALSLIADEEPGREEFLLLIILILGGVGALMIMICLCCWLFMCKNSADKKKESRLRSAEASATPSKEPRTTPPRVSLSGMDSIDELYDTPMTQTPVSGTPISRTPVTRTPTGNTPQRTSYGATPQRSDRGY